MFRTSTLGLVTLCLIFITLNFSITATAHTGASERASCTQRTSIPSNGMVDVDRSAWTTDHLLVLDVARGGILELEASSKDASLPAPRLEPVDGCGRQGGQPSPILVDRSADYQMVILPAAGSYAFGLRERELGDAASAFRLTARFVETAVVETDLVLEEPLIGGAIRVSQQDFLAASSGLKNEIEVVDPDPDKSLMAQPLLRVLTAHWNSPAKNEIEVVDPDPDKSAGGAAIMAQLILVDDQPSGTGFKNEIEVVDPDPDKALSGPVETVVGWLKVGDLAAPSGLISRQGFVRLQHPGSTSGTVEQSSSAAAQWLARVLQAETATWQLLRSGSSSSDWRILDYQAR